MHRTVYVEFNTIKVYKDKISICTLRIVFQLQSYATIYVLLTMKCFRLYQVKNKMKSYTIGLDLCFHIKKKFKNNCICLLYYCLFTTAAQNKFFC